MIVDCWLNLFIMDVVNAVGPNPGAARTSRIMMEGVGARVIRGPGWKWGKQVSFICLNKSLLSIHTLLNIIYQLYNQTL